MGQVKAVILAAGKGKRLQSEQFHLPKVLREAGGKPLLHYVLEALRFLPVEDTIVVAGYMMEKVQAAFPDYPYAIQAEQLGTGHAVQCARELLQDFDGTVLVCCGDMPLLRKETYEALLEAHANSGNTCTFLTGTSSVDLPFGRILRDQQGQFIRVVEDGDCTPQQKEIRELNAGVYAFDCQELLACLNLLNNHNKQGEYYLTDVPELMRQRGGKIGICCVELGEQIIGVNTVEQLNMVEEYLKNR
ncbi:MAG: NTP transferase domain-containing protein [Oscillospiraceae bacterium]|nr:NTP transferase domain-containing protein [Oscillospiraceae bacterium]